MASTDDLRHRLNRHLAALRVQMGSVPLARLLDDQPVACVDGRNPDGVVGAPGGNAGLFLLLLAAYERFRERRLGADEVHALFHAYLDDFGRFYLHSDTGAVDRLCDALAAADVPAELPTDTDARVAFMQRPPAELRTRLQELLADPAHLGCGHLRLIAENPDRYSVRPELLQAFLRAYFEAVWSGDDRVIFDVLEGRLDARAVLNVHTDEAPDTPVPLPCPHYDAVQLFVHHPSAIAFLRQRHVDFLAAQRLIEEDEADAFASAHERLGTEQLEVTLSVLAPELPHVDVHATASGELRLTGPAGTW